MRNMPGGSLLASTAMAALGAALALLPLTAATADIAPEAMGTAGSPQMAPGLAAAVDCGTDLSCFATQAETCGPSTVVDTLDLDLAPLLGLTEGVVSSVTDALQVEPDPDGSVGCQFGLVVQRTDVSLSDVAVQAMLDRGASQADIDQLQARMAASTSVQLGRSGTCLFGANDLASMLQRWTEGSFSTQDWTPATCTGTYFGDGR